MAESPIILDHTNGKYTVATGGTPPTEKPVAEAFDTHREAYGFACGLRMTKGGTIVDQTLKLGLDGLKGLRS